LADSRAKTKSVNRQARNNDVIEINFTENGKEGNDRFILGRGHFLPGFEEQINGHRAGDRLNFSLKAPDDYWKKELRGRSIDFRVVVKNVLERELPEINDEFAKSLGQFTTLNDFKKSVSDGLLEEKKLKEKEKVRLAVLKEIAGRAEIDIPQVMFDKMPSKEQVSSHLVVYKLAKEQGLEPTEEEVKAEMSKYQPDRVQLDPNRFYDYIYGIIQSRKVFEFLESL
jgi:trigger factor